MDPVKEAFLKVKEDISSLKEEINSIKLDLASLKSTLESLNSATLSTDTSTNNSTNPYQDQDISTDTSTHFQITNHQNTSLEALKHQNLMISTGNRGVSTDRQTDNQTDTNLQNTSFYQLKQLIESLDELKKDVVTKFQNLTEREMSVFSKIYELQELNISKIDYKILAKELKLTESSIRDHVKSIISKGIPLKKIKINNKKILLEVPEDLKNTFSLSAIISLRNL